MNAWELVAGSYFISVRCGPQPVQFTIVTELFTGELEVGDETAGLVCTGEMVFHHVVVRAVRSVCTPSPPASIVLPKSCSSLYHRCQADKSAVATVATTKELKKRSWGIYQDRIVFRQFWKPSPVRAPLLSARKGWDENLLNRRCCVVKKPAERH